MLRKDVPEVEADQRINKAQLAFSDGLDKNDEPIIDGLQLPDPKDRHVLAAAIKTNANVIVPNNRKDFPEEYLSTFGRSVKGVDDFIKDIIDLNQERAFKAFKTLVFNGTHSDLDEFQMLDRFR